MPDATPDWFDAHLDLAFLAETGRDMHTDPDECRGRYQPAAVTLPSLAEGGVRRVLATVFTEAVEDPSAPDAETGAFAYPLGNRDAAYVCGMRQLKLYHAWQDAGLVSLPNREPARAPEAEPPLRAGVLVENADPITDPDELDLWVEGGVVAIGLAWVTRGHYASGNGVPSEGVDTGLTDADADEPGPLRPGGLKNVYESGHAAHIVVTVNKEFIWDERRGRVSCRTTLYRARHPTPPAFDSAFGAIGMHAALVGLGNVERNVGGQRCLAHRGAPGKDQKVRAVQAAQLLVHVDQAGRHTGQSAFTLVGRVGHVHGVGDGAQERLEPAFGLTLFGKRIQRLFRLGDLFARLGRHVDLLRLGRQFHPVVVAVLALRFGHLDRDAILLDDKLCV